MLLTTAYTVFHSWLMVTTSCSQMLLQHLVYIHCDFLQNKKGSAPIQIAEEWGCYSSCLPFPFDFLDSVLTPLSRYPHQKNFLCPHQPVVKILACLTAEQVQVITYPYYSFPTQSEESGCYFTVWLIKLSRRQACYSNDGRREA